jgi:L-ascorbate metabolism protein UlaG (beta-lactamase superfamily)
MFRFATACLAALVLTLGASAQEEKKLSIRWHGQSFFEIHSSAGTRIVIDPHAIEAYGQKSIPADILLYTHFHTDHTQFQVVENLVKDKDKIKVLGGLKDEKGDGKRITWNQIDEKVKDVHIQTVGTYHDRFGGMRRGLNSVFILEVDGFRVVHLGDLGHELTENQLKAIGPVDILMIPVGGVYTLNGSDAKKVVAQLKPRYYVLPMHYGTRVYDYLLTADEFLEDQKNVKTSTKNELTVPVGMKAPEEPAIVTLHWSDK